MDHENTPVVKRHLPCELNSLAELQAATRPRGRAQRVATDLCGHRRTELEIWREERRWLTPLPEILPERFDVVVTRRVGIDGLVAFEGRHFEGRQYPVRFTRVGQTDEVRGRHSRVQVVAGCQILASHARHIEAGSCSTPTFEGEATDRGGAAHPPSGPDGWRLQEIAAMEPQRRPIDLYVALAEVVR